MAPEIIEMTPPTPACDIWSVGCTVVEMITEHPPYFDLSQVPALFRIVSDNHPPLPEGSSSFQAFLLECFQKNPALRIPAEQLLEHAWIQESAKHTKELARSIDSSEGRRTSRNSLDASRKSLEADEDFDDDEHEEVIATLMTTLTLNRDELSKYRDDGARSHAKTPAVLVKSPRREKGGGSTGVGQATKEDEENEPSVATDSSVGTDSKSAAKLQVPAARALHINRSDGQPSSPDSTKSLGLTTSGSLDALAVGSKASGDKEVTPRDPPTGDSTQLLESRRVSPRRNQQDRNKPRRASRDISLKSNSSQSIEVQARPRSSAFHEVSGTETPPPEGAQTPLAPGIHSQDGSSGRDLIDSHVHYSKGGVPKRQREAAEIQQLLSSIRPFEAPEKLVEICTRLMELLQKGSNIEDNKLHLVTQHGAVPIVEMLQVTDAKLLRAVLQIVNRIIDDNKGFQETLGLVGVIPAVIKFTRPNYSRELRKEAAHFMSKLCHTSPISLQMLVACGGLEALVHLVAHDYYNNRDFVWLALEALKEIFQTSTIPNNDLCRLLAKLGLCGHLVILIDTLLSDIDKDAGRHLETVVDLLLLFATDGDTVVKCYMVSYQVLEGLVSSLEYLPLSLNVRIFKILHQLAEEPQVLNVLENAGIVPVLVHFLALHLGGKSTGTSFGREVTTIGTNSSGDDVTQLSKDVRSHCLQALFSLCKISRPRQEQAALAGVLPVLQALVENRSGLRSLAMQMVCDQPRASNEARYLLWKQGGVVFFVNRLADEDTQSAALEALVEWLSIKENKSDWCAKLEAILLKEGGPFVDHLVGLICTQKPQALQKVLDALLKMVRVSVRINLAVGKHQRFIKELLDRLSVDIGGSRPSQLKAQGGGEVMVRANLLRLLLSLCQQHESLQNLCKAHSLRSRIQFILIEEQRLNRVVVREIAAQLLQLFAERLPEGDGVSTV
eukprot:gnl/MRDRNA2_/MRDRNA2_31184_c0_seq1.p1 gnl/MRDRNA2_/MRDRNA2_31184_c0~~gnl/MRDRNA2_/MRDRNA2_31184_c0_seq1.p1  ORF type:complete len:999 (+),score=193.63 gnl/MRDRNA2_/MRDRNA2_31184_c0_seq1:143-2998(+)